MSTRQTKIDLFNYARRATVEVNVGGVTIGCTNPVRVQSMTNTATADVAASVAQIERIADAGAPIVRLTAQGKAEGEAFAQIMPALRADGYNTAIVADIHFVPQIAAIAAQYVDKVRINPGNYRTDGTHSLTPDELMHMDWLCENVIGHIPTVEEVIPASRATVQLLGVFQEDVP